MEYKIRAMEKKVSYRSAAFPDIAIETSNKMATATAGNSLTEWLGSLHQYLSIQNNAFSVSPGDLNTVVGFYGSFTWFADT